MTSLLPLVVATAAAVQPPRPPDPVGVDAIVCAAHVRFTTPYPWHYGLDAAPLQTGTVLVIEADVSLLRPRNIGQRVLYVEGGPVEILARAGGTALVLVGQDLGNDRARAWFADDTLPERVDAPLAARLAAAAAQLPPVPIARWGAERVAAGRNDLLAQMGDWEGGCR